MKLADLVVAGNEFLAARAVHAGVPPDRILIVPTCVEPRLYPPKPRSLLDGLIRLVWIGSASTVRGLVQRRDLWARIGERWPNLRFRLICDEFPNLGLPVEAVGWSEATEAAALAECDVGVAWMPDDLWSRGKCGLKVLQFMAAGLPVIANPVGVHVEMVGLDRNGFLPNSDDDWVRSVSLLIEDAGLRRRMGEAGRAVVQRHYSIEAWGQRWVETVFGSGPDTNVARVDGERLRTGGGPHRAARDRRVFGRGL